MRAPAVQGLFLVSLNPSYYAARATEARRLAMASADPKVRRIHLEMAARYAILAGANPAQADEVSPGTDQLMV